jgi:hypothetical protein
MDLHAGPLGRHAASLRAGAERIGRAIDSAIVLVVAELRRLNGVGANASSRSDRVRLVKQTLARRGKGPNRCC